MVLLSLVLVLHFVLHDVGQVVHVFMSMGFVYSGRLLVCHRVQCVEVAERYVLLLQVWLVLPTGS